MKKLISLTLAILLFISACACSADNTADIVSSSETAESKSVAVISQVSSAYAEAEAESNGPDMTKKLIALTFDDGPNVMTRDFVKKFTEYNGHATFFVIGKNLSALYMDDMLYAINKGMEYGNHSNTHSDMTSLSDAAAIAADFTEAQNKMKSITGYTMKVARLPNFACNDTVFDAMEQVGLPCIGTFDCPLSLRDWSDDTEVDYIVNTVLTYVKEGDIVCMHQHQNTLQALDSILPALTEQGYAFVTVSELFEAYGYETIPMRQQIGHAEKQ